MTFEFPDTLPSKESMFATYIPARTPEFKVHRTEGLAHSALGQRNYNESYAKYEMKEGQWVKVFEHHPADACGLCGGTFQVTHPSGRTGVFRYESYAKVPKWQKEPICHNCYTTQREKQRRIDEEKRERAQYERLNQIYGPKP